MIKNEDFLDDREEGGRLVGSSPSLTTNLYAKSIYSSR